MHEEHRAQQHRLHTDSTRTDVGVLVEGCTAYRQSLLSSMLRTAEGNSLRLGWSLRLRVFVAGRSISLMCEYP